MGDPAADPLRLWTIQSPAAYRVLQRGGVLRGGAEHAAPHFAAAYRWLDEQAAQRLPTEGDALLWLWARREASFADDVRHQGGDVVLEVVAPRSHVLLSDFNEWHQVLNASPCFPPLAGESDDAWWSRVEPLLESFWDRLPDHEGPAGAEAALTDPAAWPAELRAEVERSWEWIFDERSWAHPHTWVQAVAHQIDARHVTRAFRFRGGSQR